MSIHSGRVLSFDQLSKSQVMNLWAQLFAYEEDHGLRQVYDPERVLTAIVGQLTDSGVVLLAKDGECPVGFLAGTPGAYVGTPDCALMVLGCYVDFGYHGAGVLNSLYFALRDYCRERRIESVQYVVASGNELMRPIGENHSQIVGRVFERRILRKEESDDFPVC